MTPTWKDGVRFELRKHGSKYSLDAFYEGVQARVWIDGQDIEIRGREGALDYIDGICDRMVARVKAEKASRAEGALGFGFVGDTSKES